MKRRERGRDGEKRMVEGAGETANAPTCRQGTAAAADPRSNNSFSSNCGDVRLLGAKSRVDH